MKQITIMAAVLLLVLFLAGCTKITPEDYAHAVKLCESNGGVVNTGVDSMPGGRREVTSECKDGTVFTRRGK